MQNLFCGGATNKNDSFLSLWICARWPLVEMSACKNNSINGFAMLYATKLGVGSVGRKDPLWAHCDYLGFENAIAAQRSACENNACRPITQCGTESKSGDWATFNFHHQEFRRSHFYVNFGFPLPSSWSQVWVLHYGFSLQEKGRSHQQWRISHCNENAVLRTKPPGPPEATAKPNVEWVGANFKLTPTFSELVAHWSQAVPKLYFYSDLQDFKNMTPMDVNSSVNWYPSDTESSVSLNLGVHVSHSSIKTWCNLVAQHLWGCPHLTQPTLYFALCFPGKIKTNLQY